MSRERLYPPDWVDDEEAGYLLSMGASTFRDYVSRGYFPSGVKIGGKRLWSRASINAALEKLANPALTSPVDKAIKGLIDGEKAKAEFRKVDRKPSTGRREIIPEPDRPFSIRTLAERMNCSESHIRKLIASGHIQAFSIGGKLLRISAAEVRRLETQGEPIPPEESR